MSNFILASYDGRVVNMVSGAYLSVFTTSTSESLSLHDTDIAIPQDSLIWSFVLPVL